jgi:hypothetical protein
MVVEEEGKVHRFQFAAAGLALAALMSSATAADLTPRVKAQTHAAAGNVDCVRWVRQNWSWYNYCEPVRYPPRHRYDWSGWY